MKEVLYSTKFLDFVASKREDKPDWVYAHRGNAKDVVIIVPLIHRKDGDYTLFLITKRPPIVEEYGEKYCIEFPAGLVGDEDKEETVDLALKKELLEETGYEAQTFRVMVKNMVSSGGLSSEKSTLAIGEIYDLEKKAVPVDDGGVIIDRIEVPLDEIDKFLDEMQLKNCFICAQTLAGVYYLQKSNVK